MVFESSPRLLAATGALLLAVAAFSAGVQFQQHGTLLSFGFIGSAWAAVVAAAIIRSGIAAVIAAPSRLEIPVGVPQGHAQLAARVLALELQLEHAPIALFRIDPASMQVEPVNVSARRLLAPGRATDAQQVRTIVARLVTGQRSVIEFDTEQGTERALASAVAIVAQGKAQTLAALLPVENELEAEAIRAWQKLVHVLTHEIMNSLTPVASLSQTLRALLEGVRASLPAGIANDFAVSLDAIHRRADSLTSFVSAYRVLASVPDARPQRVVVAEMFARLSALNGPAWQERGGRAHFVVEPRSLELMADPGQLEQALMNLLTNAFEASAAQPLPEVTVRAKLVRGGRLRIEVCDNGPGIPDELVADIFTPFFSTKSKGSGIGLAMVRQLIHRNGGAVRYAKSVGPGARFVITF